MKKIVLSGLLLSVLAFGWAWRRELISSFRDLKSTAPGPVDLPAAVTNEQPPVETNPPAPDAPTGFIWPGDDKLANPAGSPRWMRALARLLEDETTEGAQFRHTALDHWMLADSNAAVEWVKNVTPGPVKEQLIQQVVVSLAASDLASARGWASALPEQSSKQAALLTLVNEASRTEPREALAIAATLPATPERDEAAAHAVSEWAETDAKSALAWAQEVADVALRDRLLSSIALVQSKTDSSEAARLVSTLVTPGQEQERAAVGIVERWAQQSPQAAAEWVAQFPETSARSAAEDWLASLNGK
jgi:hypothetical protein